MILKTFTIAPHRTVGMIDHFSLELTCRDQGRDYKYSFEECSLLDMDSLDAIDAQARLDEETISQFEDYLMDALDATPICLGIDGNIIDFLDVEEGDEVGVPWAHIRFGYMTVMEV